MKNIANMTLNEMVDAGLSAEHIYAAIKERIATKEKAMKAKQVAEAAEKARQEEIAAARRQYKKAHAKYMKAITGEDMTAEEMAEFEKCVCLPMENVWEMQYAPKKIKIKAEDLDDLAAVIMNALGYK